MAFAEVAGRLGERKVVRRISRNYVGLTPEHAWLFGVHIVLYDVCAAVG